MPGASVPWSNPTGQKQDERDDKPRRRPPGTEWVDAYIEHVRESQEKDTKRKEDK